MALNIESARAIDREINLPSSIRGFEDRAFIVSIGPAGISVREKNRSESRSMTWREILSYACMHCPER